MVRVKQRYNFNGIVANAPGEHLDVEQVLQGLKKRMRTRT